MEYRTEQAAADLLSRLEKIERPNCDDPDRARLLIVTTFLIQWAELEPDEARQLSILMNALMDTLDWPDNRDREWRSNFLAKMLAEIIETGTLP